MTPTEIGTIRARQGLDLLVRRQAGTTPHIPDGQTIMDFNFSGLYAPSRFKSFDTAEARYRRLIDEMPPDEMDGVRIRQNLKADLMVISALRGDQPDYLDYCEATAGFRPERIPEANVVLLRDTFCQKMGNLGLRLDDTGAKTFDQKYVISRSDKIKPAFEASFPASLRAAAHYVKVFKEPFSIYKWVDDEKVPWSGHIDSDKRGNIRFQVNIHPSFKRTLPNIYSWSYHEVGAHFVHTQHIRHRIRRRMMSAALGVTSMLSPENTHMECVPVFTENLVPGVFAPGSEMRAVAEANEAMGNLYLACLYNGTFDVNTGSGKISSRKKAAADMMFDYMRVLPRDRFQTQMNASDQPTPSVSFLAYAFAAQLMDPIISSGDEEERKNAMRQIYERPLTISQIGRLAASIR